MARPATGSLEWKETAQSWAGRIRLPDGSRSKWRSLGTSDKTVARERLDRWLATGEPPSDAAKETFASAAERVMNKQEKDKGIQNRRHRVRTFALPVIGHVEVGCLAPHHVYSVLTRMGEQPGASKDKYAADTVHHLLTDVSRILTALVHEGVLSSNVAKEVELPDDVEVDDRPRIVLTDEEILDFRQQRGFEAELDMMALHARELGGQRTSDLHAADWSDWDLVTWKTAHVRRPKTEQKGSRKGKRRGKRRATRGYERVRHELPESVIAPTQAWWRKAGCPTSGPVFPLRRGPNAGQRKTGKGISYAQELRDALWECRIHRPLPGFEQAVGEEARRKLDALQVDTDETRAVDFHSFRRAYVTGLARAGVNAQTALLASGHSDLSTHSRYLAAPVVGVPAAALPATVLPAPAPVPPAPPAGPDLAMLLEQLAVVVRVNGGLLPGQLPGNDLASGSNGLVATESQQPKAEGFPRRARQESNLGPTASECIGDLVSALIHSVGHLREVAPESPAEPSLTQAPGQSPDAPSALAALRAAHRAASDACNWALARSLEPLIDAEAKRAPVIDLASRRAKQT